MDDDRWNPCCTPPRDLVVPSRIDPSGAQGPTRHQARGPQWVSTTYGWLVPAGTDRTRPEQRILEQSMRLEGRGAVTGWAALRLAGAAFFDGRTSDGTELPVPLVTTRQLAPSEAFVAVRRAPRRVEWRCGVPCVPVLDAVVDEIARRDDPGLPVDVATRRGVVVIDMACAARITTIDRVRAFAACVRGRKRAVVLAACELASERSLSPKETDLRLVWELDAAMGSKPLVNRLVYGLDGVLLGRPDLLDPSLGVAGEYDGALHRGRSRHRRDVERGERFRSAGIEGFVVVAGDGVDVQVARMQAARDRARARRDRGEAVGWTLDPPPGAWGEVEPSLEEEVELRERHERLVREHFGTSM